MIWSTLFIWILSYQIDLIKLSFLNLNKAIVDSFNHPWYNICNQTASQPKVNSKPSILTLLVTGFLTNDYCRGGSLGPRSFFWLILTSFWTCGTIVDQYLVKGVHQWSCRKKNLRVSYDWPSYNNFPQQENFLKIFEKNSKIFFQTLYDYSSVNS